MPSRRRASTRLFAAPIVVTAALAPACAPATQQGPGNPPEPLQMNPPAPTASAPPEVAPSAKPAAVATGGLPEGPHVNPPPPRPTASAAPTAAPSASAPAKGDLPDPPANVAPGRITKNADGSCTLFTPPPPCPPGAMCNPPPPQRVKCPPNAR